MTSTRRFGIIALLGLAALATGCAKPVRHVTAMHWRTTEAPAVAVAAPVAPPAATSTPPAAETPAPGDAAPGAEAPAPAAPQPAPAPDVVRTLYTAYWEGECWKLADGWWLVPDIRGCNVGTSKVKRCSVERDNTLRCADDVNADKALATE